MGQGATDCSQRKRGKEDKRGPVPLGRRSTTTSTTVGVVESVVIQSTPRTRPRPTRRGLPESGREEEDETTVTEMREVEPVLGRSIRTPDSKQVPTIGRYVVGQSDQGSEEGT